MHVHGGEASGPAAASSPAAGFIHQALIYGSDGEFVDVVMPFVEDGIASDEPTLVAVHERHIGNLKAALGGDSPWPSLFSADRWYETSARTRDKFARWVEEHGGDRRLRVIAESPWSIGHGAQVRDWARHEAVLNVAFNEYPVTFMCVYDRRALPDEVLAHAESTHPERVGSAGVAENKRFEDPLDFCTRLDAEVPHRPGETLLEAVFGLDDLAIVRRVATVGALNSGLSRQRAEELALAVNEVATNALVHGRPPASLRIGSREGELVFDVTDAGDGIEDAFVGQLAPPDHGLGGRGLWLTRLLCDAVEIRNDTRCAVTLRAAVPAAAPASRYA